MSAVDVLYRYGRTYTIFARRTVAAILAIFTSSAVFARLAIQHIHHMGFAGIGQGHAVAAVDVLYRYGRAYTIFARRTVAAVSSRRTIRAIPARRTRSAVLARRTVLAVKLALVRVLAHTVGNVQRLVGRCHDLFHQFRRGFGIVVNVRRAVFVQVIGHYGRDSSLARQPPHKGDLALAVLAAGCLRRHVRHIVSPQHLFHGHAVRVRVHNADRRVLPPGAAQDVQFLNAVAARHAQKDALRHCGIVSKHNGFHALTPCPLFRQVNIGQAATNAWPYFISRSINSESCA